MKSRKMRVCLSASGGIRRKHEDLRGFENLGGLGSSSTTPRQHLILVKLKIEKRVMLAANSARLFELPKINVSFFKKTETPCAPRFYHDDRLKRLPYA